MGLFYDHARIVLEAFEPKPLPIHTLYSSRRQLSAKVRVMIEFLATAFARTLSIQQGECGPAHPKLPFANNCGERPRWVVNRHPTRRDRNVAVASSH
jgi:hypothetical protein